MIKNDNYIFLIGIYYPYGEFNIMGVYTDERKLLNTYQLLVTEDGRCLKEKFPEMPVIYRIPLNQFLGQQEDCNQMNEIPYFYSNLEPEYRITIDEIYGDYNMVMDVWRNAEGVIQVTLWGETGGEKYCDLIMVEHFQS